MNKEDIYDYLNKQLTEIFNNSIKLEDLKIEKNLKIENKIELKKYFENKIRDYFNEILSKNKLFNKYEFINLKAELIVEKNKVSSINKDFNELFSKNNNILLRLGLEDNNFFTILEQYIINFDIKKKHNLIKNLTNKLNLSEGEIKLLLEKNDHSFIKKDTKKTFFNDIFYQELVNQLYLLFELSLVICVPSNKPQGKKFIYVYPNQQLPKQLYFISIVINLNDPLDKIYYEAAIVLDLINKNLNFAVRDNLLIKKISETLGDIFLTEEKERIYQATFLEEVEINEIKFDPYDKNEDLPIIEIEVEGEKRTFLLGRTNNLYEDDNHLNNLVGKLKFTDDTYSEAKIYWCKDYIE